MGYDSKESRRISSLSISYSIPRDILELRSAFQLLAKDDVDLLIEFKYLKAGS